MADKEEFTVGVGADVSKFVNEFERASSSIEKFTALLNELATAQEKSEVTASIYMETMKQFSAIQQMVGTTLAGGPGNNAQAEINKINKNIAINQIKNETQAAINAIKEAGMQVYVQGLKTTAEAIAARMKEASFRVEELQKNFGDSVVLANKRVMADLARLRTDAKVGGKSAQELFEEEQAAKGAREARRERRELRQTRSLANNTAVEDLADMRARANRIAGLEQFAGMTGEQVYEKLLKEAQEKIKETSDRQTRRYKKIKEREEQLQVTLAEDPEVVSANNTLARVRNLKNRQKVAGRSAEQIIQDEIDQKASIEAMRTAITPQMRAAQISELVRTRMDANGGADFIGLQARVLAYYGALNMMFNSVKSGLSSIVDLDKELTQFQAITQTSTAEMGPFTDRLLKIASASKFSATEIAQTATVMGQAGLTATQVSEALASTVRLATASGSSLKEATDIVTSVLGAFNVQASETANVANTMTAALNLSKLDMQKLALGIQYAGNVARDAGMSYTELTAALGALSNAGIRSGSTLGTGLRQLLTDIQNPTKKFRDTMDDLGITMADIDIKSKGLVGVLETLRDKGFGTEQAFRSFEVRAVTAFSALSNNLGMAKRFNEELAITSAATEASAVQMQSFASTASRFANAMTALTYTAFKPFMDFLTVVIGKSADAISSVNGLTTALSALGVAISVAVGTATLARIGAAAAGFMGFTQAAATMSLGLGALMANPYFLAFAATVGAITVAYGYFKNKVDELNPSIDTLNGKLNSNKAALDSTSENIKKVDDTILSLQQRNAELERDPVMRRTMLFEVQRAFKDWGLQIDVVSDSVASLTTKLQALRSENEKQRTAMLNNRIELQREKQGKQETERKLALRPMELTDIFDAAPASIMPDRFAVQQNPLIFQRFAQQAGARFGGSTTELLNLLGGQTNPESYRTDQILNLFSDVRGKLNDVNNKMRSGGQTNPRLIEEQKFLQAIVKLLDEGMGDKIMAPIKTALDIANDISAKVASEVSDRVNSTGLLADAEKTRQSAFTRLTEINKIKDRTKRLEAADVFVQEFTITEAYYRTKLEELRADMKAKLPNMGKEIDQAIDASPVMQTLIEMQGLVQGNFEALRPEVREDMLKKQVAAMAALDKQMSLIQQRISLSNSPEEIDQLTQQLTALNTQKASILETKTKVEFNKSRSDMEEQIANRLSENKAELDKAIASAKQRKIDIEKRSLKRVVDALTKDMEAVSASISAETDPNQLPNFAAEQIRLINARAAILAKILKLDFIDQNDPELKELLDLNESNRKAELKKFDEKFQATLLARQKKVLEEYDKQLQSGVTLAKSEIDRLRSEQRAVRFDSKEFTRLQDEINNWFAYMLDLLQKINEHTNKLNPPPTAFQPTTSSSATQRDIIGASTGTQTDTQWLMAMARVEGGMNPGAVNPYTQDATGLYQFIRKTWLNLIMNYGSRFGLAAEQEMLKAGNVPPADMQRILDLRKDPKFATPAALMYRDLNRVEMSRALGRETTGFEDRLGWFGPGNALSIIRGMAQGEDLPASKFLSSDFLSQNGFADDMGASIGKVYRKFLNEYLRAIDEQSGAIVNSKTARSASQQQAEEAIKASQEKANREAQERFKRESQDRIAGLTAQRSQKENMEVIDAYLQAAKDSSDPEFIRSTLIPQVKEISAKIRQFLIDQIAAEKLGITDRQLTATELMDNEKVKNDPELQAYIIEELRKYDNTIKAKINSMTEATTGAAKRAAESQFITPLTGQANRLNSPLYQNEAGQTQQDALAKQQAYAQEQAALAQIVELKKTVLLLDQQIAQYEQEGVKSEGAKTQAMATRAELLRQIAALEAGLPSNAPKPQPTFGGELNAATERFFKQAGAMKPLAVQVGQAWQDALGAISTSMTSLFVNLASGTMSAKQAFKQFAASVVQSLMQIIAKMLVMNLMQKLIGMIPGMGGPTAIPGSVTAGGGLYANGGMIRAATGYSVTRDSVPILAQPGEYILSKSAVDMVGRNNLDDLNTLGNRRRSESPVPKISNQQQKDSGTVNVWLVDKENVPPPGPRDIITYISDDIRKRGSTYQMIKSVQMGAV